MKIKLVLYGLLFLLLAGCSTKKNNFMTRQYHELTTRYNVYFNGNEALKAGEKKMELRHKEDYTNLLPAFISSNEQTRSACSGDMDYAIEKAVKAIDKHSITVKPKRRKNKDSKNYETFRKQKEFNKQIPKCYLLLGKAYFYKKKYTMANNTFRYLQRQYPDDKKLQPEVQLWLFRSNTEMGRFDEAAQNMSALSGQKLNRRQREMYEAARTDFYVRQENYSSAIQAGEALISACKSMKRKPRYYFMLSQLYLKEHQDAQAMYALKKAVRFNFNYETVFNAKINMALAYQAGDDGIRKKLVKMLKDSKNEDFQDRIYYALGNIEEKKGNEKEATGLYWKSVKASVDNDNQKSLSFLKLGDYYFKEKEYIPAQSCYDSCMFFMDSRMEGYESLRTLLADLTELVTNLNTVQKQDSLQRLAKMSAGERNAIIDSIIQNIKDEEQRVKDEERLAQQERNFYQRNDMLSRGDAFSQGGGSSSGDWYFYNPMTIALGKNEFKRKWGRRKLMDDWRRQNKSTVDFGDNKEVLAEAGEEQKGPKDTKTRDFYLQDIPLTEEKLAASEKQVENACYKAGELYLYKFQDPQKALACFEDFISRFSESPNLSLVYYLAYEAAGKAGEQGKAEKYRTELIRKFPESDFAKGLLNPEYFKKVDSDLAVVERMYKEAYDKYRGVYYNDALQICNDILSRYPDNKLSANVLFLKAMCLVNLAPVQEAREALNKVLAAGPDKEMKNVVASVLSSLDVGESPVRYTDAEMAQTRYLQSTRNWQFDAEGNLEGEESPDENPYKVDKEKEHYVMLLLPEELGKMQEMQLQGRLTFINAAQAVGGQRYEMKKEELWYKNRVLQISGFKNYSEAADYLNRIATDRILLKNLEGKTYRIFAITKDNFTILRRLKKMEQYVDFFTKNYFNDQYQGETITGKMGAEAHIFNYEENQKHHFVLMLPFRQINVKRIAEMLYSIENAFVLEKESYDNEHEMIVVKNVGSKEQALEYLNTVMKDQSLYNQLANISYQAFVITQDNLDILLENQYISEYMKFFNDHYVKQMNGEIGVEEGEFIFNKSVPHRYVLLYSNKIDPYKLKTGFEAFNFAGLSINNYKYDDENDCIVISGFGDKEEAMRYFKTVSGERKLFRPLRNTDYRNFVISESNFETLKEKKLIQPYLLFFRKYYLEN